MTQDTTPELRMAELHLKDDRTQVMAYTDRLDEWLTFEADGAKNNTGGRSRFQLK